ncbi:MAG: hypothetical protein WCL08_05830, partial [Verrucomicrobiota bacterium]
LAVLTASDAFQLLVVLQSYWRQTFRPLCIFEVLADQMQVEYSPSMGYTARLCQVRSMLAAGQDDGTALCGLVAQFGPQDRLILLQLTQRLRGSNGQEGNGYLDAQSSDSFARLMAEEASCRQNRRQSTDMALYSETPSGEGNQTPCMLTGHHGHSNSQCRTQAAEKRSGAKSSKASRFEFTRGSGLFFKRLSLQAKVAHPAKTKACTLCNQTGHFFRECPQLAAAQELAVAAPRTSNRGTRGAIAHAAVAGLDTRGYSEADLQRLAIIMTERTNGSGNRAAAAAVVANAEDSGTAAARAFVVSAFARSSIVQLGLDSMANRHLIHDRSLFDQKTIRTLATPIMITGVCGGVELREYGTAILDGIRLKNVFYCPSTPVNVLSLAALRAQYPSWKASLPPGGMQFHDADGTLKISCVVVNGLYLWHLNQMAMDTPTTRAKAVALISELERGAAVTDDVSDVNVPLSEPTGVTSFAPFMFLHRVLGHPSLKRMRWLQKLFPRLHFGQFPPSIFCDACNEGKSKRGSVPVATPVGGILPFDYFFDRAHVDIKMSTTAGWNEIHFTAIIFSEKTGFIWALHARTKDEIAGKIMAWLLMYNTHYAPTNGPVALFRADNEKALFPKSSAEFWASYGILLSFSAAYTPGHNNRAESAIRTTYMTARCLVRDSPLDDRFWPFAVDHACFLLVRRPTSAAPQTTPYGRIMRRAPTLPTLAFGTLGHWTPPAVHPMQAAQHTFSPRGFACHFLGFEANSETTMVIVSNGVIYRTIDVIFPRPGALLMTRDERTGSVNSHAAAPVTHREEYFPGLISVSSTDLLPASSLAARPAATLAGRLYHVSAYDLDCGLCAKHTARRLLLCCEFCPAVAHIRCAGLTRIPEDQWVCASCRAPQVPSDGPVDPVLWQPAGSVVPAAASPVFVPPLTLTSPVVPVEDAVTSHSVDCGLPPDHSGVCQKLSTTSGGPKRARFGPERLPASDSSDCDEPLPLSTAALISVGPRAGSRAPLRLGFLCSNAAVATAMASITGTRHLRVLQSPAAVRDLRCRSSPYPVQLNEPVAETMTPHSGQSGLREIAPLFPSPLAVKNGGDSMRLARLHGFLRLGDPPPAPILVPVPKAAAEDWKVNPLTYPLFACAVDGADDAANGGYSAFVGYDDGKPRLGQGFQYDSKRITALAADRALVNTTGRRFKKDGTVLEEKAFVYFVSKASGSWKIYCTFSQDVPYFGSVF